MSYLHTDKCCHVNSKNTIVCFDHFCFERWQLTSFSIFFDALANGDLLMGQLTPQTSLVPATGVKTPNRTDTFGFPAGRAWIMNPLNVRPSDGTIRTVRDKPKEQLISWCLESIQLKRTCVKPVLNWANVCSPNILRTLRRTMIRFLIELLVRRIWFGQSKLYFILNCLVMRCKLRPELAADAQQTA